MEAFAQHIHRGIVALEKGDAQGAARIFTKLISRKRNDPDLLHLTSLAYIQSGKEVKAAKYLKFALKIDNSHSDANNTQGVLLRQQGRIQEAILCFETAARSNPKNLRAQRNLGQALSGGNRNIEAIEIFVRLSKLLPDDGVLYELLGNAYMYLGELNLAIGCLRRSVSILPGHGSSWLTLSELDHSLSDADIETLRKMIKEPRDRAEDCSKFLMALFRIYERRGKTEDASAYLLQANNLKRSTINYDVGVAESLMKRFSDSFTNGTEFKSIPPTDHGPTPIFVIGLPRSGTTLIEQILSSHSLVGGAGECDAIGRILRITANGKLTDNPRALSRLKPGDLEKIAQQSSDLLQELSPGNTFVIDKTPTNFFYLGLIKRLWPNAPIIHCQRDLMDCAWSNYKILFAEGNNYSYDQSEIVRYFRAKEKLMTHWRKVAAGGFLDLSYEDMVSNQEQQTRLLLKYCNLPWEDTCMRFHKNSRSVRTASAAQVRKPIYKTSVKSWLPFQQFLQPLISGLAQDKIVG
jgi:tetratricopeptide (TPR) repeat protein